MRVGTIVKARLNSAINSRDEIGVCYENYGSGCSLIFEGGGYDGFSHDDLDIFGVKTMGFCKEVADYRFTNVMRLYDDFKRGVFNRAFELGKPLSTGDVIIPFPNPALRGAR